MRRHKLWRSNRLLKTAVALILISSSLGYDTRSEEELTCDESAETCENSFFDRMYEQCFDGDQGQSFCQKEDKKDIFQFGGSAQSFKQVDGTNLTMSKIFRLGTAEEAQKFNYKPASSPLFRRSFEKGSAPELQLDIRLLSCAKNDGDSPKCCCWPLAESSNMVDIWHARPDGTYSPLRDGYGDEFRSKIVTDKFAFRLETFAPGSTGSLGGLGPSGLDLPPYGPPVVHILISNVHHHRPLLVDVPISSNTMSDYRGAAWARQDQAAEPRFVTRSSSVGENGKIEMEIGLYLTYDHNAPSDIDDKDILCPSRMYGLPHSFFFEPIALCGRGLLDYLAL